MDAIQKEKIVSLLGESQNRFHIEVVDEVTSTNDILKERAKQEGLPPYFVLIASYQSQGKGRLGRKFFSPKNTGLYMSVYFEVEALEESLKTTMQAGVCAREVIRQLVNENVDIKWVNDIYYRKKKVAGILTEGVMLPSKAKWGLVMGIGINFYLPTEEVPKDIQDKAGYLLKDPKENFRNQFVAEFLNLFYGMREEGKPFIEAYKEGILSGERFIEIIKREQQYFGEILDVTDQGHLIIRTEDGFVEELSSGEISTRWR